MVRRGPGVSLAKTRTSGRGRSKVRNPAQGGCAPWASACALAVRAHKNAAGAFSRRRHGRAESRWFPAVRWSVKEARDLRQVDGPQAADGGLNAEAGGGLVAL